MNIVCRKASAGDVEQLDLVMQVIADGPGIWNKCGCR